MPTRLGLEPRAIDLTPIQSRPLTAADRQALSDFFARLHERDRRRAQASTPPKGRGKTAK